MHADNFSLQRYTERIGYHGPLRADRETLHALMRHQLFSVPFENLDVQQGRVVSLEPEEIADKILNRQRGGYCYEVNGLFAMALQALGIPYRFVAARPMFYPNRRPRTHMAIVATLDGLDWLCDLGFGSYGLRAPLRLDQLDQETPQDDDSFMLTQPTHEFVLSARVEGVWAPQFGFDLAPQEWVDFIPANYFNSTHPDTIFVRKLLVVLHNPAGRQILFGDTLKTISGGQTTKRLITPEARASVLADVFGLKGVTLAHMIR